MEMKQWITPPWTLLLAFVALNDVFLCVSTLQELPDFRKLFLLGFAFDRNATDFSSCDLLHHQSPRQMWNGFLSLIGQNPQAIDMDENLGEEDNTCPAPTHSAFPANALLPPSRLRFLFATLWLIEAVRQAFLARQIALERANFADVECKLAKLVRATQKLSRPRLQYAQYDSTPDPLEDTLRHVLRVWLPVLGTLLVWFLLLPWPWLWEGNRQPGTVHDVLCPQDTSMASVLIAQGSETVFRMLSDCYLSAKAWAWKIALPFTLWQPLALWKRLRVLARAARYFRYAGPLLRLALKLQDQFWVFTKTWRQSGAAQLRKAQRLAHRSLLRADLAHIESLAKVQNTLASLPSQLLVNNEIGTTLLATKRRQAAKLKQNLKWLERKLLFSSVDRLKSLEIYDRIMDLSKEVSTELKSAFWNAHLISPQTRFSVAWRAVVTFTLLSELTRLYWSWELSGGFDMNFAEVTSRLLGLCQTKSRPFRNWVGKLLKLPYNHPWLDTCRRTSPSSQLSLRLADYGEVFIAAVSFIDIFVWFNTGELDEAGVVVPKPFFSRCILPGTLTQVLDHPTVPQALPQMISTCWSLAGIIGFGRVLRWMLALGPAINMFLLGPTYNYLFRPMDSDEYLVYSESLGVIRTFSTTHTAALGPSAPSYQGAPLQAPASLPSFPSWADKLHDSVRSIQEETEGYGLFY